MGLGFGGVDGFGGPEREVELFARPLKRARLGVAACGRARDDERDFVACGGERFECGDCEGAGA